MPGILALRPHIFMVGLPTGSESRARVSLHGMRSPPKETQDGCRHGPQRNTGGALPRGGRVRAPWSACPLRGNCAVGRAPSTPGRAASGAHIAPKGGSRAGGALAEGASGEGEARARTQRGLRLSTECVRFVRDNDNGTYTVCLRSLLHTCAPEDSDARQETLIMGRWLDRWHTRPKWEVTTTSLSSTMAIPPLLYIAAAAPRLHVGALTLQRAVGPRHRYPIVALHHLL